MTAPSHWQKSSYSQEGGECIELAISHDALHLRESDHPETVLTPTRTALDSLLQHLRRQP